MLIVDKRKCTGCKLCEKHCPSGAIKVLDAIAEIDYSKCNGCNICINICPNTAIIRKTNTNIIKKGSRKHKLKKLTLELEKLRLKMDDIEKRIEKLQKTKSKIY